MKLIDKDAVLVEIEKLVLCTMDEHMNFYSAEAQGEYNALSKLESFIDTLEVKGVDLESEIENVRKSHFINSDFDKATLDGRNITNIAKHFFELGTRIKKEEKYEVPSVSKTEDVSVTSRMAMIDDDLKPIAEFILDYASWNLHKDEWNHPVLEVPLFRGLDALIQRGKPYCGKN